ncbi:MAG: hypothetical protein QOJ07_154, partial [Thermoleophilaceae bacterium]|nr:hypothetical protein [Thermoleophilaceae bacterium]
MMIRFSIRRTSTRRGVGAAAAVGRPSPSAGSWPAPMRTAIAVKKPKNAAIASSGTARPDGGRGPRGRGRGLSVAGGAT